MPIIGGVIAAVAGGLASGAASSAFADDYGAEGLNDAAAASSREQARIARERYKWWEELFKPIERAYGKEVEKIGGQEDQDYWAAQAGAITAQAHKNQLKALERNLLPTGTLDPSSPAANSAYTTSALTAAGDIAGAQNQARRAAYERGIQSRYGFLQLGRDMPAQAMAGLGSSASTLGNLGSAAYDRMMADKANIASAMAPVSSAISKGIQSWYGNRNQNQNQPIMGWGGSGYGGSWAPTIGTPYNPNLAAGMYARGGIVLGPGDETSDSIPARLSDGEYVLNADAVELIGKHNLDKVNAMGLTRRGIRTRYADGGAVGWGGETKMPYGITRSTMPDGEPILDEVVADDTLSFDQAFGGARTADASQFTWRGKPYTTEMAQEYKPMGELPPGLTMATMDDGEPILDTVVADDTLSFRDAFARARSAGAARFNWRGNEYNTKIKAGPAKKGKKSAPKAGIKMTHGDVQNAVRQQEGVRMSPDEMLQSIQPPTMGRRYAKGGIVTRGGGQHGRGSESPWIGGYRPLMAKYRGTGGNRGYFPYVYSGDGDNVRTRDWRAPVVEKSRGIEMSGAPVDERSFHTSEYRDEPEVRRMQGGLGRGLQLTVGRKGIVISQPARVVDRSGEFETGRDYEGETSLEETMY